MKVTRSIMCVYVVVLSSLVVVFGSSTEAFAAPAGNLCGCTLEPDEIDGGTGGLDSQCYLDCKYGNGKFRGKGWENRCNNVCKTWSPQNRDICCNGGTTKGGTRHNGCCNTVRNLCGSACIKRAAALSAISQNPNLIPEVLLAVLAGVDPVTAIDTYVAGMESSSGVVEADPSLAQ